MNILQLSPQLCVYTPLGKGLAYVIIDYGMSVNTCWMVRLADGQVKHFDANDIRLEGNPTYGYPLVPDVPEHWKDSPQKKSQAKSVIMKSNQAEAS